MITPAARRQPWISQPWLDGLFILLPPFACLLFIALFPGLFQNTDDLSEAWWVALVLLVDVAHVYSTLYRTYLDPQARQQHRYLLYVIPILSFAAAALVYSVSVRWFWRLLAYVAVYHFVRQQYGFLRLYSRHEQAPVWARRIDTIMIYSATLYPLLHWHLTAGRNFHWFVSGDFWYLSAPQWLPLLQGAYLLVLLAYVAKEGWWIYQQRCINWPRNLVVLGTALSWYVGIVALNGDMAFTLLNVVSHGVPYMALIWVHGQKNYRPAGQRTSPVLRLIFQRGWWWLFLLLIFALAFAEEGLWDLAVWQEHRQVFGWLHSGQVEVPAALLNVVVPLLTVPQLTHYIIDGFIWRIRQDNFKWNAEVRTN